MLNGCTKPHFIDEETEAEVEQLARGQVTREGWSLGSVAGGGPGAARATLRFPASVPRLCGVLARGGPCSDVWLTEGPLDSTVCV